MHGFWYITFGCLALVVIGLVVGFVLQKTAKKYLKLYKDTYAEKIKYVTSFAVSDVKKYDELNEQCEEYDLLHDRYDDSEYIGWGITIFSGAIAITFLLCSIFCPLAGKREANYFVAQKEYVELAVENGEPLENIAITQTIINQNTWLANAKASKATYGCFSKYYNVNLDDLEPIVIDREVVE